MRSDLILPPGIDSGRDGLSSPSFWGNKQIIRKYGKPLIRFHA